MSFDLFSQPNEAQRLGVAGGNLASDFADRLTGGEWTTVAYAELLMFMRGRTTFQCSEYREHVKDRVPDHELLDPRAFGTIIRAAQRNGLIRPMGYATTMRRKSHGRAERVWQVIPKAA